MTVQPWPFDLGRFNTPPNAEPGEPVPNDDGTPAGDTPATEPSPAEALAAAQADAEK